MKEKILKIEVIVKYPFNLKNMLIDMITFGFYEFGKDFGEFNLVLYNDNTLELVRSFFGKEDIRVTTTTDIKEFMDIIKNDKSIEIDEIKCVFSKKRLRFFQRKYMDMYGKQ